MFQPCDTDLVDKPRYATLILVTFEEYVVHVTHIRPFDFDSDVTPLNIVVKNTDNGGGVDRATRLSYPCEKWPPSF